MDVLYAINAKTEPAGSLSPEITGVPATLTGSSISIANLLTYVNRYFPDVLPESVLRHFGHSERPAGKLGEGATAVSGAELCERQFQSTPPREGGDMILPSQKYREYISIHAPREGGDPERRSPKRRCPYFNPRPPRGGRPPWRLPTRWSRHFNPRPPRGGRPNRVSQLHQFRYFNPRPPRGGRRLCPRPSSTPSLFQSTPPARGATIA